MASIRERNGTYTITILIGSNGGKQRRKYKKWTPPPGMPPSKIKSEVEKIAYEFEERIKNGNYFNERITFSEYKDKWIKEYAEPNLKHSTISSYLTALKRIEPVLGDMKLINIRPIHIVEYINMISKDGMRKDEHYKLIKDLRQYIIKEFKGIERFANLAGVSRKTMTAVLKGSNVSAESANNVSSTLGVDTDVLFEKQSKGKLSSRTVLDHYKLLSVMFETAVYWQFININPCNKVKPPRKERKEAEFLNEDEVRKLISYIEDVKPQNRTAILLLLHTGLRRGEICGLKWNDIDFDVGTIQVKRSLQYTSGVGHYFTDTKSDRSQRKIHLSDSILKELSGHKKKQDAMKIAHPENWIDENFVFTSDNGSYMPPHYLSRWFSRFIKKTDLPPISIHSLRHTNATLQLMNNVPVNIVAGRLGHARPSTSTDMYGHAIESVNKMAGDKLGEILSLKPLKSKNEKER